MSEVIFSVFPNENFVMFHYCISGTGTLIADIGNAVGYPNQLRFSRAFKNVYGVSPRQWRYENSLP